MQPACFLRGLWLLLYKRRHDALAIDCDSGSLQTRSSNSLGFSGLFHTAPWNVQPWNITNTGPILNTVHVYISSLSDHLYHFEVYLRYRIFHSQTTLGKWCLRFWHVNQYRPWLCRPRFRIRTSSYTELLPALLATRWAQKGADAM